MVERLEVMFVTFRLSGSMWKEGGVGFYAGFQVCLDDEVGDVDYLTWMDVREDARNTH